MNEAVPKTQRLDQWLWHARFFKTRTLAAKFVSDGNVRITRNEATQRAQKPSLTICAGDVLTFSKHDDLKIIEILSIAARRGPAIEAQSLYTDNSPPRPPKEERKPAPFDREKGMGRPTKKDRRALDALKTN